MQETQVRSLIWEDLTCHRATKPMHIKFKKNTEVGEKRK